MRKNAGTERLASAIAGGRKNKLRGEESARSGDPTGVFAPQKIGGENFGKKRKGKKSENRKNKIPIPLQNIFGYAIMPITTGRKMSVFQKKSAQHKGGKNMICLNQSGGGYKNDYL